MTYSYVRDYLLKFQQKNDEIEISKKFKYFDSKNQHDEIQQEKKLKYIKGRVINGGVLSVRYHSYSDDLKICRYFSELKYNVKTRV